MPSDRFDFEQQIIRCWNIVDDLKELDEGIFEGWVENNSEDSFSNHVMALAHVYDVKFHKLWSLFEDVMMAEVRKIKCLKKNVPQCVNNWQKNQKVKRNEIHC